MRDLEDQFDYWMAKGLEEDRRNENKDIEYFLREYNDEEIYIKGEEFADYSVWKCGEKYDQELTLVQALDTANELYRLMQEDD